MYLKNVLKKNIILNEIGETWNIRIHTSVREDQGPTNKMFEKENMEPTHEITHVRDGTNAWDNSC